MHTIVFWARIVVFTLLLCNFAADVYAQPTQLSTLSQRFAVKDYSGYLSSFPQEYKDSKPSLTLLVQAAISLDKTQQWESETGKRVLDLLSEKKDVSKMWVPEPMMTADLPGLMMGLRHLLAGNLEGLQDLFADNPPPFTAAEFVAQIPILQAHGYPLASTACTAVRAAIITGFVPDRKIIGDGICAWAEIPESQCIPLTSVMQRLLVESPRWALAIYQQALDYCLNPQTIPTPGPDASRYRDIVMATGKLCNKINLATAKSLLKGSAPSQSLGADIALVIAGEEPENAWIQIAVAELLRQNQLHSLALSVYKTALTSVPEPCKHDVRLAYFGYLRWLDEQTSDLPDHESYSHYEQHRDSLVQADAMLVDGDFTAAAASYRELVGNADNSIFLRLAAWGGLLNSDPSTALEIGSGLVDELEKSEKATTKPLVLWCCWQLWHAVNQTLPIQVKSKYCSLTGISTIRDIREAPEWSVRTANLLNRLLTLDEAPLRPDNTRQYADLRFASALILLLADHPQKAADCVICPVEEIRPAPASGWQDEEGHLLPASDQPRVIVHPERQQLLALTQDLVTAANACPEVGPSRFVFYRALVVGLLNRMKASQHQAGELKTFHTPIRIVLQETLCALDQQENPIPDASEQLKPIENALLDVQNAPQPALDFPYYGSPALIAALKATHNPIVQRAIFTVLLTTYDQYSLAIQPKNPTYAGLLAESYAQQLDQTKDTELMNYAKQLRERYMKQ